MDDSRVSLAEISTRHGESIVELLLKIQHRRLKQSKYFFDFVENLECFYVDPSDPDRKTLLREWINLFENGEYVALSYTWGPSDDELETSRGYTVENRSGETCSQSRVRNCVFQRITNYMEHLPFRGTKLLWIDRHSVPQRICKDVNCECHVCEQKRVAIQSMGHVYAFSNYPTALLGRPMRSIAELCLLHDVLRGKFVYWVGEPPRYRLSNTSPRQRVRQALELLYEVASDLWWQRAWTFQENYKSGDKMCLLISHPPRLEQRKRLYQSFGAVQGEICVNSSELSRQATRLCKAFQNSTRSPTLEEKRMIKYIEKRLGRYTVLLKESAPMSPAIIADVEERGITDLWDRISIVANCCAYPIRLDVRKLQHDGHSLNLSMLATYLLNGEILRNDRGTLESSAPNMSVSQFLKASCFDKICAPEQERKWSFNKGCRFIDVELEEAGILTKGHLWELGPIIQTSTFSDCLPGVEDPGGELTLLKRNLTQLCNRLRYMDQNTLANAIMEYMDDDADDERPCQFGEDYMFMMARELAGSIEEGKSLRLGRLQDEEGESHPYTSIFIWDDGHPGASSENGPEFAFTSIQPRKDVRGSHDANDVDRHVSLGVALTHRTAIRTADDIPRLYTKRWLLGLCFLMGCQRRKVIFPWPPALRHINPSESDGNSIGIS